MPLTVTLDEQYRESRSVSLTRDGAEQSFIFYICGNFLEEAFDDPVYGPDDDLVALAAAYTLIPPYRTIPTYGGGTIVLSLATMRVSQRSEDTWMIEVTYDIPGTGGAGGGGYANDVYDGPDAGEGNAVSYFQLSINITTETVKAQQSMAARACQKAIGLANQSVPYPFGKPAPVGHTLEEVQGYDRYERRFGFEITRYMRPEQFTMSYARLLFRMSTTKNNATFMGLPAGSVLFLEGSGSSDLFQVVPVTFGFKVQPNFILKNQNNTVLQNPAVDTPADMYDTIGDPYFSDAGSAGSPFSGWDIVDYRYAPVPDDTVKMKLQKPILRTVHQIYEFSNFALFGI